MGGSQRLMQHIARQNSEQVFYKDFSACNAYANGEAAAKSATCPALLLLGKRDVMTAPRGTATLTNAMPHAKVVQLENCGHQLMAEQPDAVLDTLFGFAGK
jgi:pimeloyl-ACP methyl ester carboxylesterase